MKCYIYLSSTSYNAEEPDIEIDAYDVKRDGDYLMLRDSNGYSHIINLIEVFSVTYK